VAAGRKALLVATYAYEDPGLRRLTAPGHDAEGLAEVLRDPTVAGFDVTVLINEPTHLVGEAIADFYGDCRRDDLTLLYFSGHGLKDDNGRLYLAMANTRRDALLFTGLAAAQIDEAMDACASRRKVLILDCCYSGAFPAGSTAKADETVHALERFQGKGRAVLTASDATQYSFEGENLLGTGSRSVFTRYLVEAIRTGEADLDADGDIALDELYSYVRERVVAERPQQHPKKQEDVDGRIIIARNVSWTLPAHLRYAIESPIAAQRLGAVDGLAHLYRVGNDMVRGVAAEQITLLAGDDSRAVSAAATALLAQLGAAGRTAPTVVGVASPVPSAARDRVQPPQAPSPQAPSPRPEPQAPPARPEPRPEPARPPEALGRTSGSPERLRRGLVLGMVLAAAALLTASRLLVFENANGYRAADLGWSTATWTLEVTVPLLLAAGLLLAARNRRAAAALAYGLLGGAALSLTGQLLEWGARFADVGYTVGPGWWSLLLGTLALVGGVAAAVSSPWLRAAPRLRRDPVAVAAALAVVAALGLWVFAVGRADLPIGSWLFYKGSGVLFTLVCLPVAVLRLDGMQRLLALAAVTTFAVAQEVGGVEIVVHQTEGFDTGAVLRALLAVLVAVAACYGAQLSRSSW
jgi:hypothetical protein